MRAADIPIRIWDQAAMVWMCTPHNPAGSVTSADDLRALYDRARHHDTLLCSDECYADLYDDEPPTSILQIAGPGSAGCLLLPLALEALRDDRLPVGGHRRGPGSNRAIKSLRTGDRDGFARVHPGRGSRGLGRR